MSRSWVAAAVLCVACEGGGAPAASEREPGPTAPNNALAGGAPSKTAPLAPASSVRAAPLAPPKAPELVIVAGGDVSLGREQGQRILAEPAYDPLRFVRPWLAGADLRFVNLESQLSEQKGETQSPHHKLVFTGPPGGAEVLRAAGIDLVSLANNHAWDYGRRGFDETLDNLARVGIAHVGVSRAPGKHYEPTVVRVRDWSVAFFAVTHIWNAGRYSTHPGRHHVAWASWPELAARVEAAHRAHDLVVLSYHGGVEYADTPYPPAKRFIEMAMQSGHVDVLLGHHPHVPRGVGWFGDRPALYSLGNLVFDKRSDKRWERTSFMARLTVARERAGRPAVRLELCGYDLRGHTPHPFEGARREHSERELAEHVLAISEAVGGTTLGVWSEDGCLEARPPSTLQEAAPTGK